ncbi:MAG: hypothetical protein RR902_03480 [Oscillospiraceae bacterium]
MTISHEKVQKMVLAAMLCAIGILIPMYSPLKIMIEPASFTLASHVVLFIGMFISPAVAGTVAIGTTVGFALAGFPPVVVVRAATQIVFVVIGALWLKKHPESIKKPINSALFAFVMALIHAVCETIASAFFFFGGGLSVPNYDKGFFVAVFLLVGVGTVVHSLVDYAIAVAIWVPLSHIESIEKLSVVGNMTGKKSKE